jgi:hypothetical protein
MPIENRNLEAGTVLTARYKKQERTCEVVKTDEGIRYRLDDGTEHKSPSSAGKAAMGGVACNGWRFWSIAGTEAPKREPKAKKEPKEKRSAPRPTRDPFDVLGVRPEASFDEVSAAYRRLAKRSHPDAGGSHDAMVELNAAYETIRERIQGTESATRASKPKAKKEAAAKTKAAPKKSAKAKSAKKGKATGAAASDASYGCGACGETFPTQKKAVAHAMTHTA